jgi:putative SOS response-associated peptidase YedK
MHSRRDRSSSDRRLEPPWNDAIGMKDGAPFAFAGLWENWKDPSGHWLRTFTIVTTRPKELVAPLHDRMPAILAPEHYDRWLGDEQDPRTLIGRFPAHTMVAWPVSTRVNSPDNDDPAILEAVA